jgi:hypothetical protein
MDGGRRYPQCNEIKAELETKTLFKILLMIVDMSSGMGTGLRMRW